MATIYRYVLQKGYLSLLRADIILGLILMISLILLQLTSAVDHLPIETSYIAWVSLLTSVVAIVVGEWQWEVRAYRMSRLYTDLARSTLAGLMTAAKQIDKLLLLLERSKIQEVAELRSNDKLTQSDSTKLLLVAKQDKAQIIALPHEILGTLKEAIKVGDAINTAANDIVTGLR